MKKTMKYFPSLITLASLALLPALQAGETNLLPEGAFESSDSDGLPEGWGLPDKNDSPWKAGNVVTIEEEGGNQYARIITTTEYPGFYALSAVVPIPAGATTIRLSARLRAEMEVVPGDWSGYKVHVSFAKEPGDGPGLKGYSLDDDSVAFSLGAATPDWTEKEHAVTVPQGAKFVGVRVLVGSMVGTFDIDDVRIYAE